MKLKFAPEPHFRTGDSVRSIYADAIIPLLMLLIIPYIYNGARVAALTLISVAACVLSEIAFCVLSKRAVTVGDLSAVVTGLIIAVMLPVTVPYYIAVCACVFAIAIAKMPFGGLGRNIFNPAAAGIAFVTVCFSDEVFKFRDTKLLSHLSAFTRPEFTPVDSPAAQLAKGARPDIMTSEMLLGNFPGAMGTTAALVIIACGLYMLIRKTIRWQIPCCFILSAALIAFCFPRIGGSRPDSVIFEMLSGSLLFCAVFMASDPVTSPKTAWGRALYGIAGGVFTMLFRKYGAYEEGAVFALLILNSLSVTLDGIVFKTQQNMREAHSNG
ncbi:MAG: RnfABCDGE type electron transport complex subunit D [Clostridia bacterium]|nr:RnfABCDGE type electron transport complex subunit D [Clostridia bacterium]